MSPRISDHPERLLFSRFNRCAALFVARLPALLIAFLGIRAMEFLYVLTKNTAPEDLSTVLWYAAIFDIVSFLKLAPVLFLPFLVICFVAPSTRMRHWAYGACGAIVVLFYAVLVKYFTETRVPLGADLFAYSPADIETVIRAGVTIDAFTVGLIIIPLALFWVVLGWLRVRKPVSSGYAVVILVVGVVLYVTPVTTSVPTAFKTEFSSVLASNKMMVFAEDSYAYFVQATGEHTGRSRPNSETAGHAVEFRYENPEYPFLRAETTPDVLGEFFDVDATKPPNLVFLLVEGLGKAFSGPNAYLGSFTPFLDELAGQSLYWENFLASQGRTFAVLPSVFASLPFADQGFNALSDRMPKHVSLLSILKHNGYRTKIYSGSDEAFDLDNQRLFVTRQRVDVVVTEKDFDESYVDGHGSGWGFPDKELMRKVLDMDSRDVRKPYVSVVQTMSMHSPFWVPNQDAYANLFEERMNRLGFDDAEKSRHRADEKIYATILYTDDALRFFFNEYKKLPAYDNTIFVLTGDHRLPEIPMSTKIDRFHVPLIIFSPMLKRPAHFESISSHLDITPSLLAFLRTQFNLRTPSIVSWVGSGLDTNPSFRNIHTYPLKHTKHNLIDFISGMYFIDQDTLFSVGKYMDLEPIRDDLEKSRLEAEFRDYKLRNEQFIRELKLIPDDLYEQFRPQ